MLHEIKIRRDIEQGTISITKNNGDTIVLCRKNNCVLDDQIFRMVEKDMADISVCYDKTCRRKRKNEN